MSNWDDLKKKLTEESQEVIEKLDQLTPEEIEVFDAEFRDYWEKESAKKSEDRDFFADKKGGMITLIQFPKKSVIERNDGLKPTATKRKGSFKWWAPKLILFKSAEKYAPTVTIFFTFKKAKEDETDEQTIERIINTLGEPDDKTRFYEVRGIIKKKYRWVNSPKKTKFLTEESFLKLAREKYNNPNIASIKEVSKGDLDETNYTFFISQNLKVI